MTTIIEDIGTPVIPSAPGLPNAGVMPLPYTKMPLFDWAMRLGLNPVHFAGGVMSGRFVNEVTCSATWPRYSWQDGHNLSHMDIAIAIGTAENLIEEYLGYHVAPWWRVETHNYPRYHNLYRTNGRNMTGRRPAMQMERSKIISVAVEKRSHLGTFPLQWQDLDGDGYNETAYILVENYGGHPAHEIALFPAGYTDHPSWQIRYPKRWGITGNDIYFLLDFWMMIDPEVLSLLPGEFHIPPNLDTSANFITHVDAYRVYQDTADTTAVSLEWEPGATCYNNDSLYTKGATGIVRDAECGLVAPSWSTSDSSWYGLMSPDRATIRYYSGEKTYEFDSGYTLNPLGGHLADAVFYLATARLTRDICACAEARALAAELRQDMSLVSPQGNFLAVADAIQTSPFGTRRGEWLAYQALKLVDRHIEVAII